MRPEIHTTEHAPLVAAPAIYYRPHGAQARLILQTRLKIRVDLSQSGQACKPGNSRVATKSCSADGG